MSNPFRAFAARHLKYLAVRSRALQRRASSARGLLPTRYLGNRLVFSRGRKRKATTSKQSRTRSAASQRKYAALYSQRLSPQEPAPNRPALHSPSFEPAANIIKFPTSPIEPMSLYPDTPAVPQKSLALRIAKPLVIAFPLVLGIAWGIGEFRAIWFAGDSMIGFHPLVLLAIVVGPGVILLGMMATVITRWFSLIATSLLGAVFIVLPLITIYHINRWAWESSIKTYSKQNQAALASTHFEAAYIVNEVPDRYDLMQPIKGFGWHCQQQIAAPGGEFRGFMINSVPHVYVRKQRPEYIGIAWVEDPKLLTSDRIKYEYTGVDKWYDWTED